MSKALIVVDMQKDFVQGWGALSVPQGDQTVIPILKRITDYDYSVVIGTRDWHPSDHCSFSDRPRFVDKSWPPHCVQNTQGAEIEGAIDDYLDVIITKGWESDREAYSGFDGEDEDGLSLDQALRHFNIEAVDIVGVATDYCVKATALDAVRYGYRTYVWLPGTRPVGQDTGDSAMNEMQEAGVELLS